MSGDHLSEAIYYAVREDFNASIEPKYIDQKHDDLIRKAIAYADGGGQLEANSVEIRALVLAAQRRGL